MSDIHLTHIDFIASLEPQVQKDITTKSDIPASRHLLSQILALIITGIWVATGTFGWQLAIVAHGVMLVFLFTLLHETVHSTVFKTQILNQAAGWICGLIIFLPPNWFRYFHLAHHRHTNDPDNDPELADIKAETLPQYFWTLTGLPVWYFHIKTIFNNAFYKVEYPYVPPRGLTKIKREARIMIAVYTTVFILGFNLAPNVILYLWLIPMLLGQPFLRLYLMAEHGRCPHVSNMFENTRTTFTTGIIRWLAWNMPYHAEHHAYPSVPFHKLPKLHEVAKRHLQTTEAGYIPFHQKTLKMLSGGHLNER